MTDTKALEKDRQTFLNIRKSVMERYGEINKRRKMKGGDQPKEKKPKRKSSDKILLLQDKLEFDKKNLEKRKNVMREREARQCLNGRRILFSSWLSNSNNSL